MVGAFKGGVIDPVLGISKLVSGGNVGQDASQYYAQQAICSHFYKKIHTDQKSIDDLANCMHTLAPEEVINAIITYLKK
jgi:hypothetical protein